MSQRMNILGRGQGLNGDETTTGAICIASQARGRVHGSDWLLQGDKTTFCPRCGVEGTIIEGEPRWRQDNIPTAVDGALVKCACPLGSNRVVAPLGQGPMPRRTPAPAAYEASPPIRASTSVRNQPQAFQPSSEPQAMEPGFFIVPRCMTYQEVLIELGAPQARLPRSILDRLNPTHKLGFKAGEIFVIGDGLSRPVCTQEELYAMSAAKQAREVLAGLTPEEAEFMMKHQAEIAGLLSDVSLAMGVSQAMMEKALDELTATMRRIETLHQQQFTLHGHLQSNEFFVERRRLFKQLDAQLRMTFLNKHMDLGKYETLRRDLGISSRSLVHHWSKAGVPGQIPGYSTHLRKLANISKYLKAGGYVGVAVGAGSGVMKIKQVCREGDAHACKKIKFTESGNFAGGIIGGALAGHASGALAAVACVSLGVVSAAACSIAIVGTGTAVGSMAGMAGGEIMGEVIYEYHEKDQVK